MCNVDWSLSRGEGNRATWSENFYIQYEGDTILYFCLFIGLRSVMPLINEYWLILIVRQVGRSDRMKFGYSGWNRSRIAMDNDRTIYEQTVQSSQQSTRWLVGRIIWTEPRALTTSVLLVFSLVNKVQSACRSRLQRCAGSKYLQTTKTATNNKTIYDQ